MPRRRLSPGRVHIDRLTALDAGNLRVEDHGVPMHVAGLAIVDGGPLRDATGHIDCAAIRAHVDRRTRSAPRLRQRLNGTPRGAGLPIWVEDPAFDIVNHVKFQELPGAADEEALLGACAALNEPPLNRSHPLWEMWLLSGSPDGSVAVLVRLHHVLADGVAALDLLGALFDGTAHQQRPPAPQQASSTDVLPRDLYQDRLLSAANTVEKSAAKLRHPVAIVRRFGSRLQQVRRLLQEGTAPTISLNRPVGAHRQLTLVRADLGRASLVAHLHRGTVNDLVLAALGGGARRILDSRGELTPGLVLKVSEAASLRRHDAGQAVGNQVGIRIIPLPLDEPDAARRLTEIARGTAARRSEAPYQPGGRILQRWMVRVMFRQRMVNVLASNLPGPAAPIIFAGARVRELFQIGLVQGNIGLSVGVLSYAGRLNFDIVADADTVPDVAMFAAGLTSALRDLDVLATGAGEATPGWSPAVPTGS